MKSEAQDEVLMACPFQLEFRIMMAADFVEKEYTAEFMEVFHANEWW